MSSTPPPSTLSQSSSSSPASTLDALVPLASPPCLSDAVDKLKLFLATAPSTFPQSSPEGNSALDEDRALNRFLLPTGELVSCVLWNGLYHVTGTDIVRALTFRFSAFGRPVKNAKKFEEGVFSDLRNLKSGTDATLEEPKSEFLELLFKHNCIRTQKKQKVFYWFSVPHDRLFLDALDRDLKREKLGQEGTTAAEREPALSFRWNPAKTLFEQFLTPTSTDAHSPTSSEGHLRTPTEASSDHWEVVDGPAQKRQRQNVDFPSELPAQQLAIPRLNCEDDNETSSGANFDECAESSYDPSLFGAIPLFEGAPTYKQRRRPLRSKKAVLSSLSPVTLSDDLSLRPNHSTRFEDEDLPSVHEPPSPVPLQSRLTTSEACSPYSPTFLQSSLHSVGFVSVLQQPVPVSPRPVVSTQHLSDVQPRYLPSGQHPGHAPYPVRIASTTNNLPSFDAAPLPSTSPTFGELSGRLKTYVCPLFSCGRFFKRLEHLKRHVRTHTSEKPFLCPICKKAFARSDNLAAHVKIHDRPLPNSPASSGKGGREWMAEGDEEEEREDEEEDLSIVPNAVSESRYLSAGDPVIGERTSIIQSASRRPFHSFVNSPSGSISHYGSTPSYRHYSPNTSSLGGSSYLHPISVLQNHHSYPELGSDSHNSPHYPSTTPSISRFDGRIYSRELALNANLSPSLYGLAMGEDTPPQSLPLDNPLHMRYQERQHLSPQVLMSWGSGTAAISTFEQVL